MLDNPNADLGLIRSLGSKGAFQIALKPRFIGRYDLLEFKDDENNLIEIDTIDKARLLRA